jgi:hypothetical protein
MSDEGITHHAIVRRRWNGVAMQASHGPVFSSGIEPSQRESVRILCPLRHRDMRARLNQAIANLLFDLASRGIHVNSIAFAKLQDRGP